MPRAIIIPTGLSSGVPQGAALISISGSRALVFHDPNLGFADRCARACSQGRPVNIDFPVNQLGFFDEQSGIVRARSPKLLAAWIGRRPGIRDLDAIDDRYERRAKARRLTIQGKTHEAFKLDRRLGF